jgi:hypothetical protein
VFAYNVVTAMTGSACDTANRRLDVHLASLLENERDP